MFTSAENNEWDRIFCPNEIKAKNVRGRTSIMWLATCISDHMCRVMLNSYFTY